MVARSSAGASSSAANTHVFIGPDYSFLLALSNSRLCGPTRCCAGGILGDRRFSVSPMGCRSTRACAARVLMHHYTGCCIRNPCAARRHTCRNCRCATVNGSLSIQRGSAGRDSTSCGFARPARGCVCEKTPGRGVVPSFVHIPP